MNLKEQLQNLSAERNTPCVTISLDTHRTHPDNKQDEILFKNLLKEAEERVINEFGKRPAAALLEKMEKVTSAIDFNYNLDSLHVFLSNDTQEIIKSAWKTSNSGVHISDSFAIRSLIKTLNRTEKYLIMLLSQSGVHLYEAVNDGVTDEIKTSGFPFPENRHYNTFPDKGSDPKHLDDLVREFFNKVDKALVRVYNETQLHCIVICTEDNYSRLQQVADKPEIYLGYANIDYNNTAPHHVASQAWEIIKTLQKKRRSDAIIEMKEAVSQGNVLTDLQEIYQAAIDGRGELLIVYQEFSQPVVMQSDRTFDIVSNPAGENAIDDITSSIAREIMSRKGRIVFTSQDEIKDLGDIALKVRY
ncbi:hypothetical protein [Fluviicola sp.]|jgi:hypothetical protein|uniref:baeRF3 domain-containing protein n=1 Tax=Fluviicola sp. TaxID=1917219 RepID=UPI002820DDB9|nr:hypothetical protein [Fluviicola sp.]MDR0801773.1 hypothetical protein [Fluviicola sp.]